jgi:hypothetical protein
MRATFYKNKLIVESNICGTDGNERYWSMEPLTLDQARAALKELNYDVELKVFEF